MGRRFSVETVFRGVDKFTAPISRMQNRMTKFTRSMRLGLRKVNRVTDKVTRGFKRFALGATLALGLVGSAMANVVSVGATFDQTLVNAAVKFPGEIRKGSIAFTELSDAAREVGRSTEFTATQGAEALNFLAFAGFDAKAAIAALPGVVNLATAAQVDLGRATDIATDSLGAFNLLSEDAAVQQANLAKVSDILVATSTRANTSVEDMFEALKQGAPIATAAGQSIETTAALIATMANAGIKGSRAGTALKNIMLAISAPTSKAGKVFKDLGIKLKTSTGGVRDALDVFDDLAEATKDLGDAKTLAAFEKIFGKIPIAAAINITNAAGSTRGFRDELRKTIGVTKEMADVMRDTLQGRLNSLSAAIEGVKISIFTMNEGPLVDVVEGMTEWVRANEDFIATSITDFVGEIAENIGLVVLATKGLVGTTAAFLAFTVATKAASVAMAVFTFVLNANPIIRVLTVLAVLVPFLVKNWRELVQAFENIPVLGPLLTIMVFNPIRELIGLAQKVRKEWEPIKAFFGSLWGDAKTGFDSFVKTVIQGMKALVRDILGPLDFITGGVLGDILGNFKGDSGEDQRADVGSPQVVSPQERVSRSIQENRTTDSVEITVRAEPGTIVDITGGGLRGRILHLQESGGL